MLSFSACAWSDFCFLSWSLSWSWVVLCSSSSARCFSRISDDFNSTSTRNSWYLANYNTSRGVKRNTHRRQLSWVASAVCIAHHGLSKPSQNYVTCQTSKQIKSSFNLTTFWCAFTQGNINSLLTLQMLLILEMSICRVQLACIGDKSQIFGTKVGGG